MSLVAYESSGEESEADDVGEVQEQTVEEKWPRPGNCAAIVSRKFEAPSLSYKEDNEEPVKGIFSFLPPPKKEQTDFIIEEEEDTIPVRKSHETNDNNAVKAGRRDKNPNWTKIEENDKKPAKLILPKPKRVDGEDKQKVKIALPSLPDDDSDSDEEVSNKKSKIPPGKGKSGLLGCLPQPKYNASIAKAPTISLTERKPSRLLMPYSLSKKKDEVKSKDAKNASKKENESDSEDDDQSTSFFSFGEKNEPITEDIKIKESTTQKKIVSNNVSLSAISRGSSDSMNGSKQQTADIFEKTIKDMKSKVNLKATIAPASQLNKGVTLKKPGATDVKLISEPVISASSSKSSTGVNIESVTGPYLSEPITGYYNSVDVAGPHDSDSVIGPYESHTGIYNQNVQSSTTYDSVTGPYSTDSGSYYNTSGYVQGGYGPAGYVPSGASAENDLYNQRKTYLNPEPNQFSYHENYESATSEQRESIDADQLRRLQGKRERRIQEVDFIDIHGEAMQCDQAALLKNVTEESMNPPKIPKNELPSGQQRRKHQITYLAFQAKEREAELRKSWAANQQTKRQTQQKYGF